MVRAISQERTITAEVTGTDRYKYFRRPVSETKDESTSPTKFPLLGLENVTELGLTAPPTTAQKLRDRSARHSVRQVRGTQTDYRESEAQTIPWTPPYTTRGTTTPEVLQLEKLTWENGLPPGRHEVEVVERLRKKRAWEAQLPPIDTEENMKTCYKLIAEMERSDWEFREKEIEHIQEQRMKQSENLLEQHHSQTRNRLAYRMEFLQDCINKLKEHKLQLIKIDKDRAMRKLCLREKTYGFKKYKRNILDELINRASELHAPMKRNGISFKNRHEFIRENKFIIDDQDICNFEYDLDFKPVFDYNKASQPKKKREICVRETRWTMENLLKLHRDLQELRAKESRYDTFTAQLEHRAKPTSRSEAPPVAIPLHDNSEESLYQAAILIQTVIHSRSMQFLMEQKRNCWKELMEELEATESSELKYEPSDTVDADKENKILKARFTGVLENIIGTTVGSSIGQTLYLLATELLRFKNEGIAHDQALQAEGARWRREMPEEGRRQKEMRRREEHNLMFSQLLDVYQESINEFLVDIVAKARENEAKLQAYEHAKEVARQLELERLRELNRVEDPIDADLLLHYVAVDGLKELARTCMLILKQKYMEARQCLVETGQAEPLSQSDDRKTSILESSKSTELKSDELSKSTDYTQSELSDSASALAETEMPLVEPCMVFEVDDKVQEWYPMPFFCVPSGDSDIFAESSVVEHEASEKEPFEPRPTLPLIPESETSSVDEPSVCTESQAAEMEKCILARFNLQKEPETAEERLLARVMRDMCYVAGSLLQTAAKILNKALQFANIPKESFEEALKRTMLVINGTLEEIVNLILPKKPEEKKVATEELIYEATVIVEGILERARQRIAEMEERKKIIAAKTEKEAYVREVVEDIIKEAQHKVLHTIVEDFLSDLIREAQHKVDIFNSE